mgnify:CR=1 FL=1
MANCNVYDVRIYPGGGKSCLWLNEAADLENELKDSLTLKNPSGGFKC